MERQELLNLLAHYELTRAHQEGWAVGKAVEYRQRHPQSTHSFKVLRKVFERYQKAQQRGRKRSLKELARGFPLQFSRVGRILHRVGLEPLYGTWDRKLLPS